MRARYSLLPMRRPARFLRRALRLSAFSLALPALSFSAAEEQPAPLRLLSPNGEIQVSVQAPEGRLQYSVSFRGQQVVLPSRLGLLLQGHQGFEEGIALLGDVQRRSQDAAWEQPWGRNRIVRDLHNELLVTARRGADGALLRLRFRAFDDGVGFRYEVPAQPGFGELNIVRELTEFALPPSARAWWTPADGHNRYEYLYNSTGLDAVGRAHTPATFRLGSGVHVSLHEAALVDYAGMILTQDYPGVFRAALRPWSDGVLVKTAAPFVSPWRTIQIAPDAVGLVNSNLILNLNEPNQLGDVSWVRPTKYMGIWWAMHINERTWGRDGVHGATTEETKRYLDFAAANGFGGLLVEGWNLGWDGDWFNNGALFSFTQPYPDFDLEAVAAHARAQGVQLIGHHETSGDVTNYENQLDAALDLYRRLGVTRVKTGYVADAGWLKWTDADGIAHYEHHDGQFAVRHHLKVVREAAKRRISINPHEPVKATGLRRTYPNWITREGARGQEYNAWGDPPNSPEHTAILPYTRMLAGPMDFTPGIFDLRPNEAPPVRADMPRGSQQSRVQTTLAKQLALYVVIYSPLQMAADLPRNYLARPQAFQFIRDVPVDWEESKALQGEVGEYVLIARRERGGRDWYLGALTNGEARRLEVPLDFLPKEGRYAAQLYLDGEGADWRENPYAFVVERRQMSAADVLVLPLAPGGGAAVRLAWQGPSP